MIGRGRLWPKGFTGRVTLVLVLAVAVQFIAGTLLIGAGEAHIQRQGLGKRIAEQLVTAERVVTAVAPQDRAPLLGSLSTIHLQMRLVEGAPQIAPGIAPDAAEIARSLVRWEPELAKNDLRLAMVRKSPLVLDRHLEGALRIAPDVWIAFETNEPVAGWTPLIRTSLTVGIVALLVLGSAAVLVRTLSAPLRQLSSDAKLIGTTARIPFDEQAGPLELRQVSHALNLMQDRIEAAMNQRTQALMAVGHDLRTPLARLRLRIGAIADEQDRAEARSDIEQMTAMLQELLEYFETGDLKQDYEPTDLSSLCQTIGEKFADLGYDVDYRGPERAVVAALHNSLTRAIENLVDNAVKFAGHATIELELTETHAVIAVQDGGPGIPWADMKRVMQPFERLDIARSGGHPGMGLGLSIVRNVAEAHGGTFELSRVEPTGLRAALVIPQKQSPEIL
ncbi:ATP-binding protein [Erythrobacter sp. LQ02-29]|uniref:sensor histidine kinase n=1 Tax=Erythrobacter sp. LQ02-29 TaxID=2920384 RepID=UPI001F4E14E1|nr:ATP-binding protein [Erythrobacter sp. LQ02-29]